MINLLKKKIIIQFLIKFYIKSNKKKKFNFTTLLHSFLLPSSPFYYFPLLHFLQTKHGLSV